MDNNCTHKLYKLMAKCFLIETKCLFLAHFVCVISLLILDCLRKKELPIMMGSAQTRLSAVFFYVAQVALCLPSNCLSRHILMRRDGYVTEIIFLNI